MTETNTPYTAVFSSSSQKLWYVNAKHPKDVALIKREKINDFLSSLIFPENTKGAANLMSGMVERSIPISNAEYPTPISVFGVKMTKTAVAQK